MNIGICGFHQSIPKVEASHYRGWCEILARSLQLINSSDHYRIVRTLDEMKKCDHLYVHSGLYYYGDVTDGFKLNLFGGEPGLADPIEAMENIVASGAKAIGLEYQLDWIEALYAMANRAKTNNDFKKRILDLQSAKVKRFGHVDAMLLAFETSGKLVIGDSHSGASWEPGFAVYRNDRETLHGALKRGLKTKIRDRFNTQVTPKVLRVHYGNIDVRFHILRQPDPPDACQELIRELRIQLEHIQRDWNCQIEVVMPYPIEPAERTLKVPKSVWYKGTAATGTFEERSSIRNLFRDNLLNMCRGNSWRPIDVVNRDVLPESMMEKPRSIHLSPAYYLTPMPLDKPKVDQTKPASTLSEFFT